MDKMLTRDDIRDFLTGFAAAIELDQLRVDALPPERFHQEYDEGMWRRWRGSHLSYIKQLLPTVDEIPVAMLEELTQIAISYDPSVVEHIALDLFADAASDSRSEEELETATRFFGWLIKEVGDGAEGKPKNGDARSLFLKWLPVTDPLHIAQDPECGYGQPAGFIS